MGRFYAISLVSVGSVSRAPAEKPIDLHGRLLRPTLPDDVVSIVFTKIRYLLDLGFDANDHESHDFILTQILRLEHRKIGQK